MLRAAAAFARAWERAVTPAKEGEPVVERYWERGNGERSFLVRRTIGTVARIEKQVDWLYWGGAPRYQLRGGGPGVEDEERDSLVGAVLRSEWGLTGTVLNPGGPAFY